MFMEYIDSMKPFVDKSMLRFFPKELSHDWIEKNLGSLNYGYDKKSFNMIAEPIWDLLDRGGKRWRPVFMLLCCDVLGGGSKVMDLVPLIEFIHNGTLMVDDVMDNSEKRRGKECIHRLFGVDVAINAGNMMYYLPYLLIKKSDLDAKRKLLLHEVIAEEMIKLHLGQSLDIYWHNNSGFATEDLYMQMCAYKTGTLVRLGAKIGAILGDAGTRKSRAVADFAEAIGVAFQIQDDILNLTAEIGKEFGYDISEGKRSLMVIKVLEDGSEPDRRRLLEILSLKTRDLKLIKEAVSIIERNNALDYARMKARKLVLKAWSRLDFVIPDSEAKKKLKLFADFVVERKI